MSILKWPINERPREKLILLGARALSDAELIAIFLQTGIKGKSAIELARDVLAHFNGLRKLLESTPEELLKIPGIGPGKTCLIQGAMELGRRYLESKVVRSQILESSQETLAYLTAELKRYPHEVFACLFLDNKHCIICFEKLFHGTLNHTAIHPREIIKRALYNNAAAIIFAHNHPSGNPQPSQADHTMTAHLRVLLAELEIKLLDHIIIGENQALSFAEHGFL